MNIQISPLETMEEVDGIVEVQRQAWNMEDLGIVPTFETRAVADAGFVYVAKVENQVVGFIYGYHHFPDIHYSHMMAVLPEFQGQNIGYKLKQFHRRKAMEAEHHVSAVLWTVDPLLPNNAYLNFAKLGGYCDIYKINYYGDPDSDGVEIYSGVPTDRFKLTWSIHSKRVKRRMKDYKSDRISLEEIFESNIVINDIVDNKWVAKKDQPEGQDSFIVEVPANYQTIRRQETDKAIDWRLKFRETCIQALDDNYIIADYHSFKDVTDDSSSMRRNFYEFIPRKGFSI